jgi:hypothetical protein
VAGAAVSFGLWGPAPRRWPGVVVCHAGCTVHRSESKYKQEKRYR